MSPSNKDRPDTRLVFAGKSAAYLQFGVGLIIIDIVTSRRFNLHNEMVQHLGLTYVLFRFPTTCSFTPSLTARFAAAKMIKSIPGRSILSVGSNLPVLPLALRRASRRSSRFERRLRGCLPPQPLTEGCSMNRLAG